MIKEQGGILDIENFHLFGDWLLSKGRFGHALLCFHGPAYGIKIKELLELKWKDFVNWKGELFLSLTLENNKVKSRLNSLLVRTKTQYVYEQLSKTKKVNGNDFVYTYTNSDKRLTTTNLNKEFNRYLEEYFNEIFSKCKLEMWVRPFKTNAFEIAWARYFVKQYNYSKKSLITVSKYLGHPSVQYTLSLLEVKMIDEIHIDSAEYDPSSETIDKISNFVKKMNDINGINFLDRMELVQENYVKVESKTFDELFPDTFSDIYPDDEIPLE